MVGDPWSFDADVFNFLGLLNTPFHLTPFWSESCLWHLFSSVTFPLGAVVKGPGTLVWHPDSDVSFWAEEGSPDNVASQPCLQKPQGLFLQLLPRGYQTKTAQPSKLLINC